MKFEFNSHRFSITLFGRTLTLRRRYATKQMEKRLAEEGPLAVCLSILYKNQGWLQDLHDRAGYSNLSGGVYPRRHGGRGRKPAGYDLSEMELRFARDALNLTHFEFGGDVSTPVEGHDGSQCDPKTGEGGHWPEKSSEGIQLPLPLDDGNDEILPPPGPSKPEGEE